MNFLITLLFIIPLLVNRSCDGSDLDLKKRCTCMSFKEKMTLLKLQYQILEKQIELKKKDKGELLSGEINKFKAALKSLTNNVSYLGKDLKKNTKTIKNTQKTVNKLSSKFKGLQGMSSQVRTNTKLLRVLNRDRCQTGEYGLLRAPNPPSWPGTKKIKFNPPFSTKPSIVHGFVVLDSDRSRNFRASVTVSDVSKTGFTLTLSKWADTKLYGLKVRWMACR